MKLRHMLAIVIALLLIGRAIPAVADDAKPGSQAPQTFEKQITVKLDYLMYLPADYEKTPDKKWPLIFFLHGSGERGSDVQKVAAHGPPKLLGEGTELAVKDFIVVSPQLPGSERGWQPMSLNLMLDDILAKYHVDKDRVYLTGLSMGGYGTWEWAATNPARFAAIAPMSGGGDPRRAARALRKMPIWNFHGEDDPTVPISESEKMVEAVQKAGNEEVKFTRYPGVGHDCWSLAYGNPELYAWFLAHTRQQPAATPAK
jgi:predicted peptidase